MTTRAPRVVVTGGAGFIGANLCRELVARGGDVVVVDDLSTGRSGNLDRVPVDLRVGSILDSALLADACTGARAVVHLAAIASVPLSVEDPATVHRVNATGTLAVLEAARAAGASCVVASSSAVYGDDPAPTKREDLAPRPLSPYAASKLAAEAYTSAFAASYGVPTLALRFFNVFGPLQPADHPYAAVVPAFISRALAGEPLLVHGDGLQSRDFVYVGDVVRVLATAALERRTHRSPVNVAVGSRTTVLDLAALVDAAVGTRSSVRHLDPRPGDVRESLADRSALLALFPDLQPVPLAAGLAATVEWFRSRSLSARG
jgi:UDP-glucose 4-epimerase